jgi:hypothetical protein
MRKLIKGFGIFIVSLMLIMNFNNCFAVNNFVVTDGILTNYTGGDVNVIIPDNLGVKSIGDRAFSPSIDNVKASNFKSVTIPEGVTSIGKWAFEYCVLLDTVKFPKSITKIDEGAFSECSNLATFTIPYGVTDIGSWAFSNCSSLKSVTIPSTVIKIGNGVFNDQYNNPRILTIYGVEGSYAQKYALQNGFTFVSKAETKKSSVKIASPTKASVTVDGKAVKFEAYNIDSRNYFKLSDIAKALDYSTKKFDVKWDSTNKIIKITKGNKYTIVGGELSTPKANKTTKAVASNVNISLNGNKITLNSYNIDGNSYFKLQDIADILDFVVKWDSTTKTVIINTTEASNPIVGTWSIIEDYEINLTFLSDGRFKMYSLGYEDTVSGTYSISGNKLTLNPDNKEYSPIILTYEIEKANSKTSLTIDDGNQTKILYKK